MMADADAGRRAARRAEGARRAARDGRLRHRLLVAQLPEPVPGRHPQDGPLVPDAGRTPITRRWPRRSSALGRDARPRGRRRGHRAAPSSRTRCASSAASSARASYFARPMEQRAARRRTCATGRPAPGHRRAGQSGEAVQHSYDSLDRPGGFDRVEPAGAAAPPGLPRSCGRDDASRCWATAVPGRDGLAGLLAVGNARPRSRSSGSR